MRTRSFGWSRLSSIRLSYCHDALVVMTLYPFLNTLAVSFNLRQRYDPRRHLLVAAGLDASELQSGVRGRNDVSMPSGYRWRERCVATVLSLFLTSMLAYTISRKEYVFRKPITIIIVLTMYFNAGLIPFIS